MQATWAKCPNGGGSSGDEVGEVGKADEAGPWGSRYEVWIIFYEG